ncbi:MAG: IPTL-CTERM sorting domain-containing protein [Planctomycetes bacterium]|nr:IPTL-CTERM sorting domain-containing protein [Planctomycetota bacterium]
MLGRGFLRHRAWTLALALGLVAAPALASYTTVLVTGVTHVDILNGVYGGSFVGTGTPIPTGLNTVFTNGTTTAYRIDDDGYGSLLHMFFGGPGTGDDDTWTDGTKFATAEARFAGFPQEVGYNSGSGYVKLFDISGSNFAVSGSGTVAFPIGSLVMWARANDSDAGLVNEHYSEETANSDGLDHMVTYKIVGAPGVPASETVWLVFWEDLNGPQGSNTDPDNQGLAADRDFNDLVIQFRITECSLDSQCDDHSECTIDGCVGGSCVFAPKLCDDKNACTADLCDPQTGCYFVDDGHCNDNNLCTEDICNPQSGACSYVAIDPSVDCDDGNECTLDLCDPILGCINPPADLGTPCGNQTPTGPCDQPDVCDGNGACVPNLAPPTQVCRFAAGVCDVEEYCTGASDQCPPDDFEPSTVECRASAGDCDVPEFCTGQGPACPPDVYQPGTLECRPSAGFCDVPEFCTGQNPNCPVDGFAPPTTVCRQGVDVCDVTEFCPGDGPDCPPDGYQPNTLECRPSAGDCDVPEFCTGQGPSCPGDAFQPPTTECRPEADVCDVPEFCTGQDANCPPDTFEPPTTECRPAAGVCDVPELCTGQGAACPADDYAPNTTVCRPAVDECDRDELCPGDGVDCPGDTFQPQGTPCPDDGNECTDDVCNGSGLCDHPNNGLCGACCLPNKSCIVDVLPATCAAQGGTHLGAGSACLGDSDGDGVDDQCDNCPGVDDAVFGVPVCCSTHMTCNDDSDCPVGESCIAACDCTDVVPAVSEWGLVVLSLLLLVFGKVYFGRRTAVAAA